MAEPRPKPTVSTCIPLCLTPLSPDFILHGSELSASSLMKYGWVVSSLPVT